MSLPPIAPRCASNTSNTGNTSNTISITTATTDIPPGKYHDDVAGVLIDEKLLHQRILQLGQEITDYYRPTTNNILVLTILKGAVLFVTDLVRAINIPTQLEFMAISSYGSGTTSSGVVRILKDLDKHIEGLDVLIVEDIIDSGLTLSWLMKNIATRNPRSLTVCTLLRKSDVTPKADVQVRFVGFDIPNEFVVGYGLDYEDFMRDLPYIGILKKSVYQNDIK